jgi:hypothetical protein
MECREPGIETSGAEGGKADRRGDALVLEERSSRLQSSVLSTSPMAEEKRENAPMPPWRVKKLSGCRNEGRHCSQTNLDTQPGSYGYLHQRIKREHVDLATHQIGDPWLTDAKMAGCFSLGETLASYPRGDGGRQG